MSQCISTKVSQLKEFGYAFMLMSSGGKTLLNLNQEDLNDLFPGDFLSRKELWDIIVNLVTSKYFINCIYYTIINLVWLSQI